MKIKTADLIGPALNWAVAKAEGLNPNSDPKVRRQYVGYSGFADANGFGYAIKHYSTDWSQGGPIIERENIGLEKHRLDGPYQWAACDWHPVVVQGYTCLERSKYVYGPGPLIAAMRLVASRLGDEVDVPDELV